MVGGCLAGLTVHICCNSVTRLMLFHECTQKFCHSYISKHWKHTMIAKGWFRFWEPFSAYANRCMLIGRVLPPFAIWTHQHHDAVSAGYSRALDCSVHRSKMRMVSFQEYDCVVVDDEQLGVEDEITSSSNPLGESV